MPRNKSLIALAAALALSATLSKADTTADTAQKIYDKATPSLVAVKYSVVGETDTTNLIIPGIVVNDQGLIMIPIAGVNQGIPNAQLKKFKIVVPHRDADNEEVDAEFVGRDERAEVAFVKPAGTEKRTWVPVKFEPTPPKIGDAVYSVGLLPKSAGYHSFLTESVVSASLRGSTKQILVAGGGLANPGSPVFNADGLAVGIVSEQFPAEPWLDEVPAQGQAQQVMRLLAPVATNKLFIPTSEFAVALSDPPTVEQPVKMAYTGLPELTGLSKDDAELFGLKNQPAVQIGDVLPNSPAEKAGLKKKDVIVKINGEPLERGEDPDELPGILRQKIRQFKPGTVVTFTIVTDKDKPLKDVPVTLEPQPKQYSKAARYWNEEIGFGVREMLVMDRYEMHLKPGDTGGVMVTTMKRDSTAAQAGLHPGDMVTQFNGKPVTGLDQFKADYEDFRRSHPHDPIVMVVARGGSKETIKIEPPQ